MWTIYVRYRDKAPLRRTLSRKTPRGLVQQAWLQARAAGDVEYSEIRDGNTVAHSTPDLGRRMRDEGIHWAP